MQECVKCSSSCLTTWLDSAWRRRGARRWRAQALRRLQRWARLLCPVLLSCKPIIFSREQMSIYVRVKELWAFGVAHKLAVIIMILASLGRPAYRPVGWHRGSASTGQDQATSRLPACKQISLFKHQVFLKTRQTTMPFQRKATARRAPRQPWPAACLNWLPATPISPNFLNSQPGGNQNWCCNFPSDLTEIITRQRGPYVHDNGLFLFRHHFSSWLETQHWCRTSPLQRQRKVQKSRGVWLSNIGTGLVYI